MTEIVPTGDGIVAFSMPGEALAAVDDVTARYETHRRRARELAEAHFDSAGVLTSLLERALERVPREAATPGARDG